MEPRRSRLPAGVVDVLAALNAGAGRRQRLSELMDATGLSAGMTLRALLTLDSLGWLRPPSGTPGFALAPLSADAGALLGASPVVPFAAALEPAQPAAHRLLPPARALIDFGVERFPFLDATRHREELRAAVSRFGAWGQLVQAGGTLRLRRQRVKQCRFGLHQLVIRRDSSTSVAHTYYECARCGAFQNSLFGDAVDRQARRTSERST